MNHRFDYFENRIRQDDIKAIVEYACMLYAGDGVKKDVEKAHDLLLQAADKNDTDAMFWLGVICENEEKYISHEEGFNWFLKAANYGNVGAQYQVGYHYLHGIYVEKSFSEAKKYFLLSANQGYPSSQNSLGTMYLRNQISSDSEEASGMVTGSIVNNQLQGWMWLMRAAKQKNPAGLYNLAGMYLEGIYVEKNVEMATSLYRLANTIGGTETRAFDMLSKIGVEMYMTALDQERLRTLFDDELVNGL